MADNEVNDGTNWFRRHVLEKLEDLHEGQKTMVLAQEKMHEMNQQSIQRLVTLTTEHQTEDSEKFSAINVELESLRLAKRVVFAFVSMVLIVVVGALVAQVTTRDTASTTREIQRLKVNP